MKELDKELRDLKKLWRDRKDLRIADQKDDAECKSIIEDALAMANHLNNIKEILKAVSEFRKVVEGYIIDAKAFGHKTQLSIFEFI